MPADPVFNDGELEYGSAALTITPKAGGDTFIVIADDTFDFSDNSQRVLQTDQFGAPAKKFGIPQLREGSCTVQLPEDKRILRGDTFVADVTADKVWIIESASNPYKKDMYRQQTISYAERLNVPA